MGFSAVFTGGLARGGSVDANLRNTGSHAAPLGLEIYGKTPSYKQGAPLEVLPTGGGRRLSCGEDGQSG